jgi:hypothetical protein
MTLVRLWAAVSAATMYGFAGGNQVNIIVTPGHVIDLCDRPRERRSPLG